MLHAVWSSTEDLDGCGSDSDLLIASNAGSGWSGPSLLNANAVTDEREDGAPRLLEASDGTLHVVWWSANDLRGTGYDTDICHATLEGAIWTLPTLVNATGFSDDEPDTWPRIVEDAAGTIHVIWESEADADGAGLDERLAAR